MRSANRNNRRPTKRNNNVGFRVARLPSPYTRNIYVQGCR
ncbi:hypothetical protein [Candidatus Venteria ishoeyi]